MCSAWTLANNRRQVQLHSAPPACDTAGGCDCDMMRYASPRTPHRHAARQRLSNSQFLKTRQNSVGVVRVSLYPAAAWPGTLTLPPRSPLSPARDPAQHCSLTCRHPGPGHRPGSGLQISHLAKPHIHLARVRSIHHQPPAARGGWGDCIQVVLLTKTKTIVLG